MGTISGLTRFSRLTEGSAAYATPKAAEPSPSPLQKGRGAGERGSSVSPILRSWQYELLGEALSTDEVARLRHVSPVLGLDFSAGTAKLIVSYENATSEKMLEHLPTMPCPGGRGGAFPQPGGRAVDDRFNPCEWTANLERSRRGGDALRGTMVRRRADQLVFLAGCTSPAEWPGPQGQRLRAHVLPDGVARPDLLLERLLYVL